MRAAVYRQNKGLVIEDVPMPEIGPGEVLVKIANTGFCGSDHSLLESGGLPDGIILGHEVSGTVVDSGHGVDRQIIGMRVAIRPTFCGECRDCRMDKPYFCQIRQAFHWYRRSARWICRICQGAAQYAHSSTKRGGFAQRSPGRGVCRCLPRDCLFRRKPWLCTGVGGRSHWPRSCASAQARGLWPGSSQ